MLFKKILEEFTGVNGVFISEMRQHKSSVFQVPCSDLFFRIRQQGRLALGADIAGPGTFKENGVKIDT